MGSIRAGDVVLPGANMKMREEVGSEQEARYLAIRIKSYI